MMCYVALTKNVDESTWWLCWKHIYGSFLINAVYLEMINLVMDFIQKYAKDTNVTEGIKIQYKLAHSYSNYNS